MGRQGELAQMVERSLSMREVRGSMPRFSIFPIYVYFISNTESNHGHYDLGTDTI